jgi:predicted AlkP superfamily pyrophosphatase or phosphodiesterase
LDRVIAPLLFSFAGDRERDTLKVAGAEPRRLYPASTLYHSLRRLGVESYCFGLRDYTPSTFSSAVMDGAEMASFQTLSEALINVGIVLARQTKPTYIHLYFDKIDSLCHEYGPNAPQVEAEIETFLLVMESFFERIFAKKKRILFLMTADHGASETDPQTTIFLNTEKRFRGVERFFKTNRRGDLLVPAGSPRDMFLYIKDEALEEAQEFLSKRLEGKADVVQVRDLMAEGYFGATLSPEFRGRVGNLVILPYRHESVWWYVKDKFEQNYYGHHGGLTAQEMETPLFLV